MVVQEEDDMEKVDLKQIVSVIPDFLRLKAPQLWLDYDEEADVLYVNFQKPVPAADSTLLENNIIQREKNGKLIGLTILNASKFNTH